jgi:hypothetical protein
MEPQPRPTVTDTQPPPVPAGSRPPGDQDAYGATIGRPAIRLGGKIAGEGAIDVPKVREAIKRVMEGGEAAFNLRREKYGF